MDFYEHEVLPRLTVERVFARVDFKSKGPHEWRGPCPLHGGDNPTAFSVNTATLRWTCFSSCGSGSALDFLEWNGEPPQLRSRDFVEAVKRAAALAGVDTSPLERELSPEEEARFAERERRGDLREAFLALARKALEQDAGKAARAYLEERGFASAEEREDFGLYTSPADVQRQLVAAGFSEAEVETSGLKDARWTGRLVIPWRDRWGQLGTFAARDLTGKAEEGAKYLYLAGAPKAPLLAFGLDVALRAPEVRSEGLILVEGLFDVLLMHARGLRHAAAIGGNGRELTAEKWAALAEAGVRSVTLALDNDETGREGTLAALANADRCRNAPVCYVVDPEDLAPYKDPDELVRKRGVGLFRELLEQSASGASYRGRQTLRDVRPDAPDRTRREAVGRVVELVNALHGPRAELDREDLFKLASEATGYSAPTLLGMAEDLGLRRRQEEAKAKLERTLREAETARVGGDLATVGSKLHEALGALEVDERDEPPAFSVERLERASRELQRGKRSRWSALDGLDVAFNPGELALVGARTGHAKTSLLVGLLRNWLEDEDDAGLLVFYSLEEPEVRVFHRLLALLSRDESTGQGWTANEVRDFYRDPESHENWPDHGLRERARERLRSWEHRLLVVPRSEWNVERLAAHARELSRRGQVSAVLVDYLQRLSAPAGSFERRDLEVSAVARQLKALAVHLGAPVVAGAQINREAVKDAKAIPTGANYTDEKVQAALRSRRPQLHHLREGGSEQEADLVLGLLNYRADFEEEEREDQRSTVPSVTRLEVGTLKSRYGEVGRWASLAFEGRYHLVRDPLNGELEP